MVGGHEYAKNGRDLCCTSSPKKRVVKVTKEQRAIVVLARHAELCPYNNYKITQHILDILGLEEALPTVTGRLQGKRKSK